MAGIGDLSAIENERKALEVLSKEVQKTSTPQERDALMAEIGRTAARLQGMCEKLQQEADKVVVPKVENLQVDAVVEVILTPAQRQRVLEKTGVDVPSVRIPDSTGALTKNMRHIEPDYIEACAMKQAEAFNRMVAAAQS